MYVIYTVRGGALDASCCPSICLYVCIKYNIDHTSGSVVEEKGRGKVLEVVWESVGHLERMKRGSGIKDRDDRSSGIEILMTDDFAKINPTDA